MSSNKYMRPVGTYVPPAKRVKAEKFDVGSEEYQRAAWDDSKRKIKGLINRASSDNIKTIIEELLKCNLIRYKGPFASALLQAQETSQVFTDVYAAILAVTNARIKTLGELVLNRLILQYKLSFKNNNKPRLIASVKFIAHLTNQDVVYEHLAFQLIQHLISQPTPTLIEILIAFIKECGSKLEQSNSMLLHETFRRLRELSLEEDYDSRTNELIEEVHIIRKNKFKNYPTMKKELDLLDEEERITHSLALLEPPEGVPGRSPGKDDFHMEYNYFKFDPNWSENEAKYEGFIKHLFGEANDSSSEDSDSDGDGDANDEHEESEEEEEEDKKPDIKDGLLTAKVEEKFIDETGQDLSAFRRTIHLTIRSSISHEEAVHKLVKLNIKPDQYDALCDMILDCCENERTYVQIYGLIASNYCQINRREFAPRFERMFEQSYGVVHLLPDSNKIRNIAKFYAHLLVTESINWNCLSCLQLRDNATTSAGRCFIKFLFQELVSTISMSTLIEYINDPAREEGFKNLFPKDPEQDMRFAINFFTLSELGQLTDGLRKELLSRQEQE